MSAPLAPDELGRRLSEVYGVLGPLYRRAVRAIEAGEAIEGVAFGVRTVLELLDAAGSQPVPRIAERLVVSRQFVQRMVNEAAAAGLVELRANPAHRRSSLVALTPEGAARFAAIRSREQAAMREVGGDLTAEDVDACLRVLRAMSAHVAAA